MQDERAKEQARAQIDSICEMMEALTVAREGGVVTYDGDELDEDQIRERIEENALSVQVRSNWQSQGETLKPAKFEILLCTGGPAVRIIGDIGQHDEPDTAKVEYQDWFTAWTEYRNTTPEEEQAILGYCRMYYWE